MEFEIVLHIHDEIIAECPADQEGSLELMTKIMTTVPDWAPGLPLATEGWEGDRYEKR